MRIDPARTLVTLLAAAILSAPLGCGEQPRQSAAAPQPDVTAQERLAESTKPSADQPLSQADEEPPDEPDTQDFVSTDDEAAKFQSETGNVITRSLPRFHDAFPSDEAFLGWVQTFHLHKDFAKTPQAIGYYCASPLFENRADRIPMSDFFGMILRQDDDTVDLTYNELMLEGRVEELTVLGFALWFADTPRSRKFDGRAKVDWTDEQLVRMLHMTFQAKVVDSMERPIDKDPRVVSMLWYEYFASGDLDRARKAILNAYMYSAPEATWQRYAGEASHAILTRVLPYDADVRAIVEEEAATSPSPPIRTYLRMMLEQAGPIRERPGIAAGS
ncbi:MAG: hypothetical protein H6813_01755 [Phycisphaeraceae bacterium]|nr:hypothetical protein [Phycisphaeraceae bacterium]